MPNTPHRANRVKKNQYQLPLIQYFPWMPKARVFDERFIANGWREPTSEKHAWFGYFIGDAMSKSSLMTTPEKTLFYELCLIATAEKTIGSIEISDLVERFAEEWTSQQIREWAKGIADCGYLRWVDRDRIIIIHPQDRWVSCLNAPRQLADLFRKADAS
jgi:hypothetical protein